MSTPKTFEEFSNNNKEYIFESKMGFAQSAWNAAAEATRQEMQAEIDKRDEVIKLFVFNNYALEAIDNPTHKDKNKNFVIEAMHPEEHKLGLPRFIGYGSCFMSALFNCYEGTLKELNQGSKDE